MNYLLRKSADALEWRLNSAKKRALHRIYERRLKALQNSGHPKSRQLTHAVALLQRHDVSGGNSLIDAIESERASMLLSKELLVDGSLGEGGIYDQNQRIGNVTAVSKGQNAATFLYHLIRELKPLVALELGTNIGISSAYQAGALQLNGNGRLVTFESSPYRLRLARRLHEKLGLTDNISYKMGLFADTLEQALKELDPIDYAFIDGHHLYQPTLDYFNAILNYAADQAVFVFDDISWSTEMKQAWGELKQDLRVIVAADFGSMGVCVIDRHRSNAQRYVTRPIPIL